LIPKVANSRTETRAGKAYIFNFKRLNFGLFPDFRFFKNLKFEKATFAISDRN